MSSSPPHVLIAPNAFKGSLTSFRFCSIMEKELTEYGISSLSFPMGDGGDGTADVLAHYTQATPIEVHTIDALGRELKSLYYRQGDTAIIELAASCGIKHLKRYEYTITETNTAGFGIVIREAIHAGCKKLILCIGGSASVDGGIGALTELGLITGRDNILHRNALLNIKNISLQALQKTMEGIETTILCDVDNPVCGPDGAAFVFAPQKGACPEQVVLLDRQLAFWSSLLPARNNEDFLRLKYGGAAGGVALSFHALLNATLVSGSGFCISLSGLREQLANADALITGEGKVDKQSLSGKIPGSISRLGSEQHIPVYAIAGIAEKDIYPFFEHIFTLSSYASSIEDSIINAPHYLKMLAGQVAECLYNHHYFREQ